MDDNEEANDFPNGLNPYFYSSGINYMNLLKNLGSSLIYLMLLLIAFLFQFLIMPFKNKNPVVKRVTNYV